MTLIATNQPGVKAQNENMVRSDRKSSVESYFSTNSSRIYKNKFSLFKIQENKKILEGFKSLPNNWNTYGANTFDSNFIDRIADVLSSLEYQPKIFPTGRNTIQLEYHSNGDYLEFEISENNTIEYFYNKAGQESEGQINIDQLNSILEYFYA